MGLKVVELTKRYGKTLALDQVSLTLHPGIYGLLGPNGSGKSTLMNLITGNLLPTSGEVCWNGVPISKLGKSYRSLIGYVPQQQTLYPDFSVGMFLDYMSALKGIPGAEARRQKKRLLDWVDLSDVEKKKIHTLSGGMKQRLLIAQAMLGTPQILIMDEPTVGLDPNQRQQIRNLIREAGEGRIVLIATHIVSDLERLSEQVILLKQGSVILQGKPQEVIAKAGEEAPGPGTIASLEDVYLHYFGNGEKNEKHDSL